jgi:hypothetical protein
VPREYCQRCAAEVPVDDGVCFFGHEVDPDAAPTGHRTDQPTDRPGATAPGPEVGADTSDADDGDDDLFAARTEPFGATDERVETDLDLEIVTPGDEPVDDAAPSPAVGDRDAVRTDEVARGGVAPPDDPAVDDGAVDEDPAPAAGGDDVDVGALEAAIAELETRDGDDSDRAGGARSEAEEGAEPATEDAAVDAGDARGAAAEERRPDHPTDGPEIDDPLAGEDLEAGLTWEGEVEAAEDAVEEPAAAAVDDRDAFADWDLDDWTDEPAEPPPTGPGGVEPATADVHAGEGRWADDPFALLEDDLAPRADRDRVADAPREDAPAPEADRVPRWDARDDERERVTAHDDEREPEDGRDRSDLAIDPTSFTARDRKRKGLLSRLFG